MGLGQQMIALGPGLFAMMRPLENFDLSIRSTVGHRPEQQQGGPFPARASMLHLRELPVSRPPYIVFRFLCLLRTSWPAHSYTAQQMHLNDDQLWVFVLSVGW